MNPKVKFGIRKADDGLYDMWMKVSEGAILPGRTQKVFPAQLTIVTDADAVLSNVTGNEPKTGTYDPATGRVTRGGPVAWSQNPKGIYKDLAFHPFTISASMDWWPDMRAGEACLMFSFECDGEPRMWDNEADPHSDTPGLQGRDFSNGISLLNSDLKGFQQAYTGKFER